MTELFLLDCSGLPDPAGCPGILESLPASRVEKALRMRFADGRRLSLGAGLLQTYILAGRGIDPASVRTEANGRPYVEADPPLSFSLSHSGIYALAAVSDRPVGCDIEEISGRRREGIAEHFYSEGEREMIACSEDPAETFFRIWTARESYIKMTGEGIGLEFARYEVLPGAVSLGSLQLPGSPCTTLGGRLHTEKDVGLRAEKDVGPRAEKDVGPRAEKDVGLRAEKDVGLRAEKAMAHGGDTGAPSGGEAPVLLRGESGASAALPGPASAQPCGDIRFSEVRLLSPGASPALSCAGIPATGPISALWIRRDGKRENCRVRQFSLVKERYSVAVCTAS